ncbi:hypothetical protein APHAL10511_003266 [Amanita phalloides]|nr:hypothetical protein APHAL10511_003266 [Amanita phalloides]
MRRQQKNKDGKVLRVHLLPKRKVITPTLIMDYAAASLSKCPETSPLVTTVLKDRKMSSIAIPDNDLSSRIQAADDNDLQYKIYHELTKITNCLNAAAKRPATEAGPSVTRRRSCGILASHHVAARDSDNKMPTLETAEYDAFGQQFTTLVIISTFTANLIIGFLTLAHNTISAMPSVRIVQNEVGMFFALGGMAIHSGVIVVAGRCAALAFKYAKRVPVHSSDEIQKEMQQGRQQGRSGPGSRSPTNELAEDAKGAPQQNEEVQKVQDQINQPSATITTENSSPDFVTCIPQLFHSRTYKGTAVPATPCSPVSSVAPIEASQALHLSDFHRFLRVCETLQLLGTAIFFLGLRLRNLLDKLDNQVLANLGNKAVDQAGEERPDVAARRHQYNAGDEGPGERQGGGYKGEASKKVVEGRFFERPLVGYGRCGEV